MKWSYRPSSNDVHFLRCSPHRPSYYHRLLSVPSWAIVTKCLLPPLTVSPLLCVAPSLYPSSPLLPCSLPTPWHPPPSPHPLNSSLLTSLTAPPHLNCSPLSILPHSTLTPPLHCTLSLSLILHSIFLPLPSLLVSPPINLDTFEISFN